MRSCPELEPDAPAKKPSRIEVSGVILLYGIGIVFLFAIGVLVWRLSHGERARDSVITVRAVSGPFVCEAIGQGNVESSSNVNIVSEIAGKTTIVSLVPEGTWVRKGEVIAQLDTQGIESRMLLFQHWKENAPTILQEYRAEVQETEAALAEYLCGTVKASRMEIENSIAKTRNDIAESKRLTESSERLVKAGYTTDTQLEVDRIVLRKHLNSLKKSMLDRHVLLRYSSERRIVSQVSRIEAARVAYTELEKSFQYVVKELKLIEEQYEACTMKSPRDGQIVYANQRLRPGMSESEIIQEGATVKKGQLMFRIPDPDKMQIRTLVGESSILQIKEGMRAVIVFDVLRNHSFEGVVTKVNRYPELIPWDPRKRFVVLVEVKSPESVRKANIDLRTGLSAEVRVIVQQKSNAVIVPLHALIRSGEKYYCLTRHIATWHAREVLVDGTNVSEAAVMDGLEPGDTIIAGANRYLNKVQLPPPESPSIFGPRRRSETESIPDTDSQKRPSETAGRNAKPSPGGESGVEEPAASGAKSKPTDLAAIRNKPKILPTSEVSDEQKIRLHQKKIEPIKQYFEYSTVECCMRLDTNEDERVSREEVRQAMPGLESLFDEWDRNGNNYLEYTEIAMGLYHAKFFSGKESESSKSAFPLADQ